MILIILLLIITDITRLVLPLATIARLHRLFNTGQALLILLVRSCDANNNQNDGYNMYTKTTGTATQRQQAPLHSQDNFHIAVIQPLQMAYHGNIHYMIVYHMGEND